MTRGNVTQASALQYVHVRETSCVCELATILILFVQTDPVPFYFQLVENKLVLFLLSVAMTTQSFLVDPGEVKEKQIQTLSPGSYPGEDCFVSEYTRLFFSPFFYLFVDILPSLTNVDVTRNFPG